MGRVWIVAWIACLAAALSAVPALAEPALWVIKSPVSTIYLFGTVHLLPADLNWKSEKIETAFASSGELWEEIDWDDDPVALRALLIDLGMDEKHPLSSKLTPADRALFDRLTEDFPGGSTAFEQLKPWAAAMVVASLQDQKHHYDPNDGADMVLRHEAFDDGIQIDPFVSVEQQYRYLGDMPPDMELSFFRDTLKYAPKASAMLDQIIAAWMRGDVDALAKMNAEMKERTPAFYQRILTDRNKLWADILVQQLERRGTQFVAGGAAHFAGPDSVIAELAKRGIVAQRL